MALIYIRTTMSKTAIILGATGLTGGILLEKILSDPMFEKVVLFSRSSVGVTHPKLEEHLIDLLQLKNYADVFKGDVVFCCVGTTKAQTPDKETYRKIDYGIPVTAAKLCVQNKIDRFIGMSAMGASSESSVFYNKVKGEMERDVLQQNIPHTYLLQPSLLGGKRKDKRLGERLAKIFMGVFGFLLPKQYRTIEPETIATTMVLLTQKEIPETRITSDKIKEIAHA